MASTNTHTGSQTRENVAPQISKPPLYHVFLLNDNFTTMDFVVHVLEDIFHKNSVEATQIMLHVHKQGKGLAGIYPKDVAETKSDIVQTRAREHGFPLKCSVEKE